MKLANAIYVALTADFPRRIFPLMRQVIKNLGGRIFTANRTNDRNCKPARCSPAPIGREREREKRALREFSDLRWQEGGRRGVERRTVGSCLCCGSYSAPHLFTPPLSSLVVDGGRKKEAPREKPDFPRHPGSRDKRHTYSGTSVLGAEYCRGSGP